MIHHIQNALDRDAGRTKAKRALCCVLLGALIAGCDAVDSMKNGFAHSQAISNSLEKSVGLKSFVGFNWANGSLNSVSITFQGIPSDRPLAEIVETSKRAIAQEFKQTPKQIVIGFTISQ